MYKTLILALAMAFYADAAAIDNTLPLTKRDKVSTLFPDIVASSLPACASLCAPVEPLISPCRGQNFTAVGCNAFCDQSAFDALYACVQCNANESKKEAKLFTPDQATALRQDQLGIYQACDRARESIRGRDFNLTIAGNTNFQLMVSSASPTIGLGWTSLGPRVGAAAGLGAVVLAGVVVLL